MITAQASAPPGKVLNRDTVAQVLHHGLSGSFTGQKVLVLIPDHTRSLPLADLFPLLVEGLADARRLDFMVALGTHPVLNAEQLCALVGLTIEEKDRCYPQVGLFNHAWNSPGELVGIGLLTSERIREIAGQAWHPTLDGDVPVRINRLALEYDHILIVGPTFPHEVAGFSGGAKYLFPGISGPEMINVSHWLGALVGIPATIGVRHTPVREMIHAAASFLATPVTLVSLVVSGHDLAGIFIGDLFSAWEAAAALSSEHHIVWRRQPFQSVLSWAPSMYDELWTAGKAVYKLEPVIADGGELIIHAPHLETVSHVHGEHIYAIGYHVLPYYLGQWDRFKHIPLGVLAHSTHVRGAGWYDGGQERPRFRVVLASKISPEDCARLNLGYLDPDTVHPEDWAGREDEGVLLVRRAGEMLYRLQEE
jgi:lactate racemase